MTVCLLAASVSDPPIGSCYTQPNPNNILSYRVRGLFAAYSISKKCSVGLNQLVHSTVCTPFN